MLQRHNPNTFECNQPSFIFQQDNALSHASKWTLCRLKQEGIEVLEHPGNSPDMNAIEGSWMPMRIAITTDWGALHTIERTERAWRGEWDKIPQDKIRAMVA
jgi:hypothetical protein